MKKISNLTILAIPCDRAFIVANDKFETFKNAPKNEKLRKRNNELVKKLKINMN